MDNRAIAQQLLDYARFLDTRDGNLYRVRAYRLAAETVLRLDQPVVQIVTEQGRSGLEALPGIGSHLSYTIDGLVRTGEFRTMDSAGGHIDVERLFASLPGIGPHLARQIHQQLGIDSLEQLEEAAHDGRLSTLPIGAKRLRGVIDALAGRRSQPPGRTDPGRARCGGAAGHRSGVSQPGRAGRLADPGTATLQPGE